MLNVCLFWIVAVWLNLLYTRYSQKRVSRAEYHLILRRCWIPGYFVYHDGLFLNAEADELTAVFITHERMVYQLVQRAQSNNGLSWKTSQLPQPRFMVPFGAWGDGYLQPIASSLAALFIFVGIIVLWEMLGLVAIIDRNLFERKQTPNPTFYPW